MDKIGLWSSTGVICEDARMEIFTAGDSVDVFTEQRLKDDEGSLYCDIKLEKAEEALPLRKYRYKRRNKELICDGKFTCNCIWIPNVNSSALNLLIQFNKHKLGLKFSDWQHSEPIDALASLKAFLEPVTDIFEIRQKQIFMFHIIKIKFAPVVGNSGNADDNGSEIAVGNNNDSLRIMVDDPVQKSVDNVRKSCKGKIRNLIKIIIITYSLKFNLISYFSSKVLQICCLSCLAAAFALLPTFKAGFVELTEKNSNEDLNFKFYLFTFCSTRVGNLVACRGGDPEFSVTNFLKIFKVVYLDCSRVGIIACCRVGNWVDVNVNEFSNLKHRYEIRSN